MFSGYSFSDWFLCAVSGPMQCYFLWSSGYLWCDCSYYIADQVGSNKTTLPSWLHACWIFTVCLRDHCWVCQSSLRVSFLFSGLALNCVTPVQKEDSFNYFHWLDINRKSIVRQCNCKFLFVRAMFRGSSCVYTQPPFLFWWSMVIVYFFGSIFEGITRDTAYFYDTHNYSYLPVGVVTMVVVYFLWFYFACRHYVMLRGNFKAKELREEGRNIKVKSAPQLQE